MNRKYTYPILVFVVSLAFYFLNDIIDEHNRKRHIREHTSPKEKTNTALLPSSTTGSIVHHKFYSLSYVEKYEQAEWVAYELKASHLSGNHYKRPFFEMDKAVQTQAAHWRNYKHSGYSKGHLCPAADRRFSLEAYEETFLTSNATPQKQDFNAGIWNTLEQKIRNWALQYNSVYVVTGGVLTDDLNTIGDEEVAVPDYFYKIILNQQDGLTRMIAFLIPHENSRKALAQYVVPVDTIEALTGIDFFPALADAIETELEQKLNIPFWSF